jgi:inosine-uridine nucleoside N-ribohydrolase
MPGGFLSEEDPVSTAEPGTAGGTPLIIDTDIGDDPDDTVALVIAARTEPALALVVTSDEREGARARFARQLLDRLGRSDVVVAAGAQIAPTGPGMCVRDLIDPDVARQTTEVADAVAAVAGRSAGPVRWLGIGFLSNLAALWEHRADLAARLVVTQMGGALERDPSRPEFNFGGDPQATRTVLTGVTRPALVVADLTYRPQTQVEPGSPLCTGLGGAGPGSWSYLVSEQFRAWFAIPKPSFQHDPLALSVALGQDFVTFETARIALDEAGRMSLAADGAEVRLSRTVDYERFMAWLHEGLGLPAVGDRPTGPTPQAGGRAAGLTRFRIGTGLADLPDLQPAAFDPDAGAAGTRARLLTVETDGRWQRRYVAAESASGGQAAGNGATGLAALLPVYWPAGRSWPDPAYAPAGWPIPDLSAAEVTPDRCLLVGGVYDHRTALHLPDDVTLARNALREVARMAVESDRCLVFPFVHARARRILDAATGGRIRWGVLEHEARFHNVLQAEGTTARVRGVLRRDRRIIERAATTASVAPWQDAAPQAAGLIAEHNLRLGRLDDPEFVRMRYTQWADCAGVRVIVFDARAGSQHGVLTALVWQDTLELLEIGLPPSDDPARLALYLDLIFHRPHAYARENRLNTIRAGTAARTPKASRGAAFEPLHGGVLDSENTEWLARGPDQRRSE